MNMDAEDLSLAVQQEIISIFGREVGLRDFKDRLARNGAQQIFAVASRCLKALPVGSHAAQRILLIGERRCLLGPYLQGMFEAKGYRKVFRPPNLWIINARGYVQYGGLVWNCGTSTSRKG